MPLTTPCLSYDHDTINQSSNLIANMGNTTSLHADFFGDDGGNPAILYGEQPLLSVLDRSGWRRSSDWQPATGNCSVCWCWWLDVITVQCSPCVSSSVPRVCLCVLLLTLQVFRL